MYKEALIEKKMGYYDYHKEKTNSKLCVTANLCSCM